MCPQAGGKMQNDMQEDFDNWTYTLRKVDLKIGLKAGLIFGLIRFCETGLKIQNLCNAM